MDTVKNNYKLLKAVEVIFNDDSIRITKRNRERARILMRPPLEAELFKAPHGI